jgi:hypothetical protein
MIGWNIRKYAEWRSVTSGWSFGGINSNGLLSTASIIYLIPTSVVIFEKPVVTHLHYKFLIFCETRRCITAFNQRLALIPILSQTNPIHTFQPYFFKIDFNVIISSTPKSSYSSLFFRPPDQNIVHISHIPIRATCHARLIHHYLIVLTILVEKYLQIMKLLSEQVWSTI